MSVFVCLCNLYSVIVYLTTLNCANAQKLQAVKNLTIFHRLQNSYKVMLLCRIICIIWSIIVTK